MAVKPITKGAIRDGMHAQVNQVDSATSSLVSSIESLYANFVSKFKDRLIAEGKGSLAESLSLQNSVRVLADLDSILNEAGLGDVALQYREQFIPIATTALNTFDKIGLDKSFAGLDGSVLDALVDNHVNDFVLNVSETVLPTMRQILVAGAGGQLTFADALAQVSAVAPDLRIDQIETLVSDTFMSFNRQVKDEKAKELGLEIAWVQGPDDDVTRPLCEEVLNDDPHGVPGMYYVDELADLDNEQNGTYLIQGGGYNCRHTIERIDLATALELGFEPESN